MQIGNNFDYSQRNNTVPTKIRKADSNEKVMSDLGFIANSEEVKEQDDYSPW